MKTPRLIENEFDGFMCAVGLADAPGVQRKEMRSAFFAGAYAFWKLIEANASVGPDVSDQDMAMMEAIQLEFEAFRAALAASF
ncbi:hypothetical protein [Magnetospirillum sulfuroxidans]|uniref:Uncharacterized protein n=1 Tax=Magnetospirillum sulfuroxidans TaxID=611300 RepID=A0ABS5I8S6_9PROT|nr:hypothetical protein [Magnetospirillum sulfuroxidans]MBR9970843.1 hypothetical protein [Magnetospirillum sulfuroxidans]